MDKKIVFFFIFLQVAFLAKGENKLISMMIEHTMECMSQVSETFTTETCQEMLRENNDNSLPKYKECKCLSTCVAKRLGLIDEQGNGHLEKLKSYVSSIESESWLKEANMLVEKCKDIKKGAECELAYNWMACAVTNSNMTRDFIKTFMGDIKKTDEKERK